MTEYSVTYYNINKPNRNGHVFGKAFIDYFHGPIYNELKFVPVFYDAPNEDYDSCDVTKMIGVAEFVDGTEDKLTMKIKSIREDLQIPEDKVATFQAVADVVYEPDDIVSITDISHLSMFLTDKCAFDTTVDFDIREDLARIIDTHLIMNECEDKVSAYDIADDIIQNNYRKED